MALIIKDLTPDNILEGQSKELWATGFNFIAPVTVVVNGVSIVPFLIVDNLVKFVIHSLRTGVYTVFFRNGDGSSYSLSNGLNVSANPVALGDYGSAANPMVLPQRIISANPTATINSNDTNSAYNTSAAVSVQNGVVTGEKPVFYSPEPTATATTSKTILNTPWGTFEN